MRSCLQPSGNWGSGDAHMQSLPPPSQMVTVSSVAIAAENENDTPITAAATAILPPRLLLAPAGGVKSAENNPMLCSTPV
ncbi:MAG: hypothetical protein ACLPPF_13785 [Rhodomicrobium sp.]